MKFLILSMTIFCLFSSIGKSYGSFVPNAFSAKIKQKVESALGGERVSSGELKYQKRGKVYLKIESPVKDQYTFVSNGKKIWYYIPPLNEKGKGELTVQNSQNSPIGIFFDALDKGLQDNELYQVTKLKNSVQINFKEKMRSKLNLKEGLIYFSKGNKKNSFDFGRIESIDLTYNDNRKISLILSKVETQKSFPKTTFHFNPPANTNIK